MTFRRKITRKLRFFWDLFAFGVVNRFKVIFALDKTALAMGKIVVFPSGLGVGNFLEAWGSVKVI